MQNHYVLPAFYELVKTGFVEGDRYLLLACEHGATTARFTAENYAELVTHVRAMVKDAPEALASTQALLLNNALARMKVFGKTRDGDLLTQACRLALGALPLDDHEARGWNLAVVVLHEPPAVPLDESKPEGTQLKALVVDVQYVGVPTLPAGQQPRETSALITREGSPVKHEGVGLLRSRRYIN